MKIAVIGGGSSYTPELVDGLLEKREQLGLERIDLMDPDEDRLATVGGFAERMAKHRGAPNLIRTTNTLETAIDGADFVLNQMRVGGQQARHEDIRLSLEFDLIGQETTGMGGFAKALRTIPVVLDLCRSMEQTCPKAWLLNFTNPSGLVTEAIVHHSYVRALGLCNIPIDAQMSLAAHLGCSYDTIDLDYVGLNHLSWIRRVTVDGTDQTQELIGALEKGTPANLPDLDDPPDLVRAVGGFPLYYLRFFYHRHRMLQMLKESPKTRAEEVMEIEERLFEIYRDPAVMVKPEELSQRGGAYYSVVAVDLIEAIHTNSGKEMIVNVVNDGAIPNLPDDCVVEVPAAITAESAKPREMEAMGPEQLGLLMAVKCYEQLTVKASVEKSRKHAIAAMLAHPLGPDADQADALLDRIIAKDGIELS